MPFRPAFVCASLVLLTAFSAAALAAPPLDTSEAEPSIVPLLAAGADTSHLAAEARVAKAESQQASRWSAPHLPGASTRLVEAATAVANAANTPRSGKSLPPDLEQALDRLQAADQLLRVGYPMFADDALAGPLGLRTALQQRTAETVSRWQSASAPLLAAAKVLRASPNAKAAHLQLEQGLSALVPMLKSAQMQPDLQLPVHRPGFAPPALTQANSIAPSYADPQDPLPLTEDLLPSGEVQFTQGVLQKAQELGYRYVELFDFVRSNVRTEWSAGSTQGPDRTLRRLAGNDVEQASLLISLLRASGAPARYVLGVVEVPAADLARQMGVPESQLGRALTAAGIAHRARLSGGRIVAYQIRHVWVSARVPYGNYRGTVADTTEPTWIPLMPALKPAVFEAGTGVLARVPHDMQGWLQAYLSNPQQALPWPQLRQRWASALAALQPPVELVGLAGHHEVDAPAIGLLPTSTPYPVIAVHAEFGTLPDEERQWLRVRLTDPEHPQAAPLLDTQVALGDLASHRFTLAFLPATVEDQHMTNANGALGAFPLNLIRLRPSLMSEGLAARPGRGEVVGGTLLEMEIELATPNGSLRTRQRLHAGSIAGFALDPHGDGTREPAPVDGLSDIPLGGLLLNRFAERYLAEWATAESESAALMGLRILRPAPALAIALPKVVPVGAAGFAERLEFQGVVLDAALRPLEPVALHDRAGLERDWLQLTALQGSALESLAFEDQWGVRAVSADRLLQQAEDVLALQPGASLDQLGAHAEPVRQQVAHWLAQGRHVHIPRHPQTVEAWTGSAWRVQDVDTGESGYFLSGGYAGGATAVPPGLWYFQEIADALGHPYAELPNDDPTAGTLIQLIPASQEQITRAGELAERQLEVVVLDRTGRPVFGAPVEFAIQKGSGLLRGPGGASEQSAVTVTTNRLGHAEAGFRAPRTGEGLPSLFNRIDESPRFELAYPTTIEVRLDYAEGLVRSGIPFIGYMVSGPVAEIDFIPVVGPHVATLFAPLGLVHDPAWYLLPKMQRGHYGVKVHDAYGNPVGGVDLTVAVSDSYNQECLDADPFSSPEHSRVYRLDACPSLPLELPQGAECAAQSIELTTGPSRWTSVGVVPSNIYETQISLAAHAGGVSGVRDLKAGAHHYHVWNGQWQCAPAITPVLLIELDFKWIDQIVSPGSVLPSRRVAAVAPTFQAGSASYLPDTFFRRFGVPMSVDGGSAGPVRWIDEWIFEFDVTASEQPSKIIPKVRHEIDGVDYGFVGLSPAWSVDLPAPRLNPPSLAIDEFGRTRHDIEFTAEISPQEFAVPSTIRFLLESGQGDLVGVCSVPVEAERRSCSLARGLPIDPAETYQARYIINSGTSNPLISDTLDVRVGSSIVAAFGSLGTGVPLPELDFLLGDRFPRLLQIQTEIDTQTDYVCQSGNRFLFALGQPARVDLEFFALDEDGARGSSALLALSNAAYDTGVFEEDLALGRLPFGAYEFELRARTDAEDEVHVGRLVHREKRRGALPLGRSLVKGVDVHDGHAVLSAEDVALGGRGPGLRFTRTYNSHAGDDETVLGRGWHSDIEAQIVPDSCGSYVVTGAAGQGQRYVPDGIYADGSPRFRSGNGFHGTLRRIPGSSTDFDFFSKDGTRHHFAERDVGGTRLSYIEDPSGNRVTYEYSRTQAGLRVTRAVDSAGRALSFDYRVQRLEREVLGVPEVEHRTLLTAVTGPGGLRVAYTYAGDGNLQRVVRTGSGGAQRDEHYAYRDFGGLWLRQSGEPRYYHLGYRLTEARDAVLDLARTYTWQVGWSGLQTPDGSVYPIPELRVETLAETDAGTVRFGYAGLRPLEPTVTTVTDARNHSSTYTMNRYGATERLVAPAGTTLTEWDVTHLQPRAITDVLGTRTAWTFDAHGNRLSETVTHSAGTLSRSWSYVSPEAFAVPIKDRPRSATDARGLTTQYAYDARGRRTGQSRGGITEAYGHAANGDLTSITNGAGELVTYGYDAYGHRSSESDDLGSRASASFDVLGRKLSERNGEGDEVSYTYDALDRVRSITHAAGSRRIDYQGRTRTERDELGHATVFEHDAQGRLLRQRDAADNERLLTYDTHGNQLSESDYRGHVTTHAYDAANRRVRTDAPLQRVTTYEHNALGQILSQRTQGGASAPRETRFEYAHPLNLPTLERQRISDQDWAETASVHDANGNLTQRTDAEGRVTVQVFDDRDRLVRIEGPGGRVETFGYNGADRRIAATLNTEPPQQRTWVFDVRGQQTRHVDGTGARWEQGFDRAGRVIATIDPLGATVTHAYDGAGRLIHESGPRAGQFVAYTLDAAGNRTETTDAAGRVIVHTFDTLNRLESRTDDVGLIERLGYDADGRLTACTNGRGETTRFEFNALGHETLRVLPPNQGGERALQFTPGVHGEVLAETDANGNATTHAYDGLGRRVSSVLPAVPGGGNTRRWTYDRVGNVLSHTDAEGRETTYEYNAQNQRTRQTDPGPPATTQTWTHDVAGNVLRHVDRRGIVHTQRYDGESRPLERTRDGLRIETLQYDGTGRVLTRTDARGEETRYTFDAGGSVLSESRPLGTVQRWTYLPWGGMATHTDADGLSTAYRYDTRQRRIEETDPAGAITTHAYDTADHRIRSTRPGNAEWHYAYDADGRLIEVRSPEGHTTVYTHDRHGNRIQQRDATGATTVYTHDARHRVTAIAHPVGGNERFDYNGEGERIAHTDRAGQRIDLARDGLGRLTERRYGAAQSGEVGREAFTLDGDGQPTTLSQYGEADGPHHVQRRYDGQGRLTQETDRFGQRSDWSYDEAGNRLSLRDPAGTTSTQPDRLNRPVRLTTQDGSTELAYSAAGRLERIVHPNGARSDYAHDSAGRIHRIVHRQGSSEVARFEYTHDARGNRTEERRIDASGTQTTRYDYDKDDRLTGSTVTAPDSTVTTTIYTLDAVGNRSREQVRRGTTPVSDVAYIYEAHQRLTETRDSITGVTTTYAYDARGQLIAETTAGQTTTYRPNAQDRLATLTLPGAPPIDYAYDTEGKRIERRTPSELTRFGWDGQTLRRETNAANNVIEAHDWAAGRILQSRRLTTPRYAQHDALRSPIRWSQSNGTEQGQLRYDAWGSTTDTNPDLPRIAYTGHYREREGSSYYAQQRYYRPGLGRFTRVDPWEGNVLNPLTLNKYLYANGNPLTYTDPTGMYAEYGHYYTVLLAAHEAGYSMKDSLRLALYAQLPDEIGRLDAINQALSRATTDAEYELTVPEEVLVQHVASERNPSGLMRRVDDGLSMSTVHPNLHVLNGGQSGLTTERAIRTVLAAPSLEAKGMALHALGDSFSHRRLGSETRMYPTRAGHFWDDARPDMIAHRPELYREYVKTLVSTLAQARGEPMSEDRAETFARSLASLADAPRAEALENIRVYLEEDKKNGRVANSEVVLAQQTGRTTLRNMQLNQYMVKAEERIAAALVQRAEALVVAEGAAAEVLLRPENAQLSHWASTSRAGGVKQLDDFWAHSYEGKGGGGSSLSKLDIGESIYKEDTSLSRILAVASSYMSAYSACEVASCRAD